MTRLHLLVAAIAALAPLAHAETCPELDPSVMAPEITNLDPTCTRCGDGGTAIAFNTPPDAFSSASVHVAYRDAANSAVKLAVCTIGTTCTPEAFTVDNTDDVGNFGISLAVDSASRPFVAYYDATNTALKVAVCEAAGSCNAPVVSTVDGVDGAASADSVGAYAAVAFGTDEKAMISYWDMTNNDLKVAHCDNADCTTVFASSIYEFPGNHDDDSGSVLYYPTAIAFGADGHGLVAFCGCARNAACDAAERKLVVAHCDDDGLCTTATASDVDTTAVAAGSPAFAGRHPSLAIGADDMPLVAYTARTGGAHPRFQLKVAHCADAACTTATLSVVDTSAGSATSEAFAHTSVAVGLDNLAVVAYYDGGASDLAVAHCENAACSASTVYVPVASAGVLGTWAALAVNPSASANVVSYYDQGNQRLQVAKLTPCTSAPSAAPSASPTTLAPTPSPSTLAPTPSPTGEADCAHPSHPRCAALGLAPNTADCCPTKLGVWSECCDTIAPTFAPSPPPPARLEGEGATPDAGLVVGGIFLFAVLGYGLHWVSVRCKDLDLESKPRGGSSVYSTTSSDAGGRPPTGP